MPDNTVCDIIPAELVPTTREVALAIRAAHRNLQVWATWSFSGDMMTEWALPNADAPLLRQRTTYDVEYDMDGNPRRTNERHEQWLVVVRKAT